jgi:colicin import membrane protein/SWI/SNF-related matrix-associated actin-dependent regulator 1 of chromatin subfamily A
MTRDLLVETVRKPPGPGRLVVAGVVGACALGVGLGMWARPATPGEAKTPAAPKAMAHAEPARPALQIVLEEAAAPIGNRLEVLPADVRAPEAAPPPRPAEPMAPRRAASGLVKVDAVVLPDPAPAPALHAPPKARAEQPQQLEWVVDEPLRPKAQPARPKAPETRIAEAKAAAAARLAADRAEAKARKAAELARAEKLEEAKAVRLAKAAQQAKAEKLELARLEKARAEKAKAAKLAQAEARRDAEKALRLAKAEKAARADKAARIEKAKVEAKAKRLALLKVVKTEPRPVVRPKAVKVAVRPAPKAPAAAPARKPAPKPVLRGSGPMRVARANPCASPDPGEAAVCADTRLSARDRQLQQAYRNAEAAGVPPSALRLQQARWLQARAAAAREAPWAVEDVYVARISELKDQTRDAREN